MRLLIDLLAILEPYGTSSYFVMFGILMACGFGFPMPEDIVLISGGILASRGITTFWIVHAVCLFGVLGGDAVVFFMGRKFGPAIKSRGIFRKIINDKIDQRVAAVMHKYGDKVIFKTYKEVTAKGRNAQTFELSRSEVKSIKWIN